MEVTEEFSSCDIDVYCIHRISLFGGWYEGSLLPKLTVVEGFANNPSNDRWRGHFKTAVLNSISILLKCESARIVVQILMHIYVTIGEC